MLPFIIYITFTLFLQAPTKIHRLYSAQAPLAPQTWQFRQVVRAARTFLQKSFTPWKNILTPPKFLMNSSQSCQSLNQVEISNNILKGHFAFLKPISIYGLKKDYFSLKFV